MGHLSAFDRYIFGGVAAITAALGLLWIVLYETDPLNSACGSVKLETLASNKGFMHAAQIVLTKAPTATSDNVGWFLLGACKMDEKQTLGHAADAVVKYLNDIGKFN